MLVERLILHPLKRVQIGGVLGPAQPSLMMLRRPISGRRKYLFVSIRRMAVSTAERGFSETIFYARVIIVAGLTPSLRIAKSADNCCNSLRFTLGDHGPGNIFGVLTV